MRFFDAIKALLPRSRAFELFIDNAKYRFMKVLAVFVDTIRAVAEAVYHDLFPDATREMERWLRAFGLNPSDVPHDGADEPTTRGLLTALWRMKAGGQSGSYLESVLRCVAPMSRVIENIPAANPCGIDRRTLAVNGVPTMRCGSHKARCNAFEWGPYGAFTPTILQNGDSGIYAIPNSLRWWETCFFVCADVVHDAHQRIVRVDPLIIHQKWRKLIELLIFKVKPLHTTAILCAVWWEGVPPIPHPPKQPAYQAGNGLIGDLYPPNLSSHLYYRDIFDGCCYYAKTSHWRQRRAESIYDYYYAASQFCAFICHRCEIVGCIWTAELLRCFVQNKEEI
jgi:uncharacterized protein YmfQ (DUF2313 family)